MSFDEQIMFKDKILTDHISSPSGGFRVYCHSDIFYNVHRFKNWGLSPGYSAGAYSVM